MCSQYVLQKWRKSEAEGRAIRGDRHAYNNLQHTKNASLTLY